MAASSSSSSVAVLGLRLSLLASFLIVISAGNFYNDVDIIWGHGKAKILDFGNLLTLNLDKESGSGFESKNEYLFGKIDMQIKLVPRNSAGTVTTFYMTSKGADWDEIDFEFLGNITGQPYILHTNVICQGKGDREQQFYLWFDPTADFHTYSIVWSPKHIVFYVDGIPIREFKNMFEIPFPNKQPMNVLATLWNADDWATQGGRVKTDWSYAPFTASFKNFNADACVWSYGKSYCNSNSPYSSYNSKMWFWEELDFGKKGQMKWVQDDYMIYDYCKDTKRFSQGLPRECTLNQIF
ncbi:hypothetical protein ACOSP7_012768 [Xanthoceras sorbifolium]|uniref:Xyloglucan endotransglucosylase/hydrolase n=1 Tax=Xanthoceras sorbifolium TaxID=99658 RepID=A0ABQ8HYS8_9ROSI|nr:hypothetical protein JRO89_XS06G0153000 [Xanthoceras sorbifolium]